MLCKRYTVASCVRLISRLSCLNAV
uniref:Uncharacterized protein n=1 Tax=Arundo donax TaxID=35708 RepID=A0A0A9B1U8_ARUDO